ncbi:hypothetical protein ACVINW_006326 [Bradyrhizobium sp. USDA 4461]
MQTTTGRPADSAGAILSGLALQQRERETTLHALARLRKEAAAEIDRLIAFLDASDPYVTTELEDQADDHPIDWDELEQNLSPGGVRPCDPDPDGDLERDDSDDEPSLGFLERHPSAYGYWERSSTGHQLDLCAGLGHDLEDEHDGREPGEDDEPSLGSLGGDQRRWAAGGLMDREQDRCG